MKPLSFINDIKSMIDPCLNGCNIDELVKVNNNNIKNKNGRVFNFKNFKIKNKKTIFYCLKCLREYDITVNWNKYDIGIVVTASLRCLNKTSRDVEFDTHDFIYLREYDAATPTIEKN